MVVVFVIFFIVGITSLLRAKKMKSMGDLSFNGEGNPKNGDI